MSEIVGMQKQRSELASEAAALIAKIQSTPKADPRRAEYVDRKMVVDRQLKRLNAAIKHWNVTHSPSTLPAAEGDEPAGDDPSWMEPTDGTFGLDPKDLCAIAAMHAIITSNQGHYDEIATAKYAWKMADAMFPDTDDDSDADGTGTDGTDAPETKT